MTNEKYVVLTECTIWKVLHNTYSETSIILVIIEVFIKDMLSLTVVKMPNLK